MTELILTSNRNNLKSGCNIGNAQPNELTKQSGDIDGIKPRSSRIYYFFKSSRLIYLFDIIG